MEFKAGDRVHVLRYNGEDVDFYGTLKYVDKCMANLFDCTIKRNEGVAVFLPSDNSFGEDKEDYYILAEDEEDKRTINDLDTNAYETRFITEDEEDTNGGNNMPTIKRKVEMNLPQLIEWGFENDVTNTWYRASNVEEYISEVFFDATGLPQFSNTVNKNDTFTVEVEEEITEDTVIDEMLLVYDNGVTHIAENKSLSFISKGNLKSAYYMNDDLRLILIWRDGRLVE